MKEKKSYDYAIPTEDLVKKYKNTGNPVTRSVYRDIITKRVVEDLVEVMEYYADEATYKQPVMSVDPNIHYDKGDKARAVLQQIKEYDKE